MTWQAWLMFALLFTAGVIAIGGLLLLAVLSFWRDKSQDLNWPFGGGVPDEKWAEDWEEDLHGQN